VNMSPNLINIFGFTDKDKDVNNKLIYVFNLANQYEPSSLFNLNHGFSTVYVLCE
jgi:hypothetical protein